MLVCVGRSINGCFVFGSHQLVASELWKLQRSGSLTSWLLGGLCQQEALEGDRKAGGGRGRTPLCFPGTRAAAGSCLNPVSSDAWHQLCHILSHVPAAGGVHPPALWVQATLCAPSPSRLCPLVHRSPCHVSLPSSEFQTPPMEPSASGPGTPASSLCSPVLVGGTLLCSY